MPLSYLAVAPAVVALTTLCTDSSSTILSDVRGFFLLSRKRGCFGLAFFLLLVLLLMPLVQLVSYGQEGNKYDYEKCRIVCGGLL